MKTAAAAVDGGDAQVRLSYGKWVTDFTGLELNRAAMVMAEELESARILDGKTEGARVLI